jgi:signal peptidase I
MAAGSDHGSGEDVPPDDVRPQTSLSTPLIEQPTPPAGAPTGDGQRSPSDESGLKTETAGAPPPDAPPGSGTPSKGQPTRPKHRKGGLSFIRELPFLLLVAFVLALLIKTFLVQAFYIPSGSMIPTLDIGDRVLVNKVVYHLHPPRRGDIIVFSDPHPTVSGHRNPASAFLHWLTEGLGVTTSPDKDFIKRVIGLPGEEVEMHRCVVYIDGKALHEPYLDGHTFNNCEYRPVRVSADSLFVMGDNRDDSNDSRYQLGFIPEDKVVGRAFIIIWPPGRIHLLHGF